MDLASYELFGPVVAELDEPIRVIQWGEAVIEIGAYAGKIYLNRGYLQRNRRKTREPHRSTGAARGWVRLAPQSDRVP